METMRPILDYYRPARRYWFAWRPALLVWLILATAVLGLWLLAEPMQGFAEMYAMVARPFSSQALLWLQDHLLPHYRWAYLLVLSGIIGFVMAWFARSPQVAQEKKSWVRQYGLWYISFLLVGVVLLAASLLGPAWSYRQWIAGLPTEPNRITTYSHLSAEEGTVIFGNGMDDYSNRSRAWRCPMPRVAPKPMGNILKSWLWRRTDLS